MDMTSKLLAIYLAEINDLYWRLPADRRRVRREIAAGLVALGLILAVAIVLYMVS
jgi:hypothetical protein